MQYYKVIPLTKIPLGRDPHFTYSSEKEIPFGSLAQISFGKKQLRGVTAEQASRPKKFRAKEIKKILAEQIIDNNQLQLAKFVSDYYFSPLGVVLKFLAPEISKTAKSKNKEEPLKKHPNNIILTTSQKKAVGEIEKGKPEEQFVLYGPASSGKTEIIMSLAEINLNQNKQTLILIPDIFLSYQEIQRYQKRFGHLATLIHSKMPKEEFSRNWKQIKTGEAKVIISTRMGVFLPFSKLGLVAIDEEQDSSHKSWDQSPKYSDKIVSQGLCRIHGAKLVCCSATPSIETLANKKAALVKLPNLTTKQIRVKSPRVKIVDLRKDYFKRKNHLFSKELLDEIEKALKNHQQSIILAPRRGKSKAVVCEGCKKILTCKNCDLPLSSIGESFKCLHCNYRISGLSKCPSCGSFKLKSIGFGTEKIAGQLQSIFPKVKIAAADRETFQKEESRKRIFEELDNGQIDILVGTTTIIKGLDIANIALAAVLSDTGWSGKSEYKFHEKYLGSFFQLAGRLNRPGSVQNGIFLLQTWNPQNPLLKYVQNWDWLKFFKDEKKQRKALKYPPYCHLIKLTAKDTSLEKVEKKTEMAYNKISAVPNSGIIEITEPYFGSIKKTRNVWQKHLLIKTKNPHGRKLSKILGEISKEWIIDIEPENIF